MRAVAVALLLACGAFAQYIPPSGGSSSAGSGVSYCAPSSASATTYTCAPSTALTSYSAGTTLSFVPDVTGTGGATTINVSGLGAKSIKMADGSTNPGSADIVALYAYLLTYDGTVFRLSPRNHASLGAGASSISRTASAGVGGVTAKLLAAKDTTDPTRRVLPSSGGCGGGIAATTATVGNAFELYVVPGTVITGVADNTVTAGHILVGGTSTVGRVRDSGFTSRTSVSGGTCIVGVALAGATVGQDALFEYDGPGTYGTGPVPLTSATSITFAGLVGQVECSASCAITLPPTITAGARYCAWGAHNTAAVITFAALGGSLKYEYTNHQSYGTAGTGTLASTGLIGDFMCIVGSADGTYYRPDSWDGTFNAN